MNSHQRCLFSLLHIRKAGGLFVGGGYSAIGVGYAGDAATSPNKNFGQNLLDLGNLVGFGRNLDKIKAKFGQI